MGGQVGDTGSIIHKELNFKLITALPLFWIIAMWGWLKR